MVLLSRTEGAEHAERFSIFHFELAQRTQRARDRSPPIHFVITQKDAEGVQIV